VVVFQKRKFGRGAQFFSKFLARKNFEIFWRDIQTTLRKVKRRGRWEFFELGIKGKEELIEGISHFSHVTAL
jgi:hypothetical protein